MELPKCTPPIVKLVGQGDESGNELAITAEVAFHFLLDGCTTYATVFIQPDSDIQCLLGMNIWVERVKGEVMFELTSRGSSPKVRIYAPG